MVNAASAAWNHVSGCAEANLQIKGDGPVFLDNRMLCLDTMAIIEAKMTKHGGLDFETNIEWLFANLVETAICTRMDFFKSLLENHSLAAKKLNEELFGVNIPLLRLIANGQIFNPNFVHPGDDLQESNKEGPKCQELLDKWIQTNSKVTPWGGLTIVEDNRALPARSFSFSSSEKIGKLKNYSHPQLHPMRNQKRTGDVWIFVPTTGCLPMGSFCGTHAYGVSHPNLINASVMQLSYVSTLADDPAHGRSSKAAPCEPDPEKAPEQKTTVDMLSIAPNFDLQLEACIAEETAKTIVTFDLKPPITMNRSPIRAPGSTVERKGSPEDILTEITTMFTKWRVSGWATSPEGDPMDSDRRCRDRMDLACKESTKDRKDEHALARIMSRLIPHMGAHIRAYHFLCFQTQIGYRDNEQITLNEVAEVIPMIIQQGWLKPRPRGDYDKYLSGGNLHLITKDFKGKGRLRALWDITGYALQEGTWTNPTTVEMYFYQLAVFWGMKAPKELPTLPGIGGDGTLFIGFDTPSIVWNLKYIESLKVKKIVLDEEDKSTSTSNKIVPKAVSKAPVITQQPWDPVLGDSVHAYAWWTLSKEETVAIINDQKSRSSKRPASQIAESPPASKRASVPKGSVAKTPTTSSKTGADPAPPKETVRRSQRLLQPQ